MRRTPFLYSYTWFRNTFRSAGRMSGDDIMLIKLKMKREKWSEVFLQVSSPGTDAAGGLATFVHVVQSETYEVSVHHSYGAGE